MKNTKSVKAMKKEIAEMSSKLKWDFLELALSMASFAGYFFFNRWIINSFLHNDGLSSAVAFVLTSVKASVRSLRKTVEARDESSH